MGCGLCMYGTQPTSETTYSRERRKRVPRRQEHFPIALGSELECAINAMMNEKSQHLLRSARVERNATMRKESHAVFPL